MVTFINSSNDTYKLKISNEIYEILPGNTLTSETVGVYAGKEVEYAQLYVAGDIISKTGTGILADGNFFYAQTGSQTAVIGHIGVEMHGFLSSMKNYGTIQGYGRGSVGFLSEAYSSVVLTNYGTITGDVGTEHGDGAIRNWGMIRGDSIAVMLDTYQGFGQSSIENFGTITVGSSTGKAIVGDAGGSAVYNNGGKIIGSVFLNDGNDSFANLYGGTVDGTVYGGKGDDAYAIDNTTTNFVEYANEGSDTVVSYINYSLKANFENLTFMGSQNLDGSGNSVANRLWGNAGDNKLSGLGGNDRIDGDAGHDILIGGSGKDTFVLAGGTGVDIVNDFKNGEDKIEIFNCGPGMDYQTLMAGISQIGADVHIKHDTDDLVLKSISINQIDESDFIFT